MLISFLWTLFCFGIIWTLAYHKSALSVWTLSLFLLLSMTVSFSLLPLYFTSLFWIFFCFLVLPLNYLPLRRALFSRFIFSFFQKSMPKMSKTEKEALEAGTVGFEGELFSGAPNWDKLLALSPPKLSPEEEAFIAGPLEALCAKIEDWEFTHELSNLPEEVWTFLKEKGFFGFIIPKIYGGLEFSAWALSSILVKIYTRSIGLASTVAVPNSLGPAELLLKYGTEEQKSRLLPRLAKGEEIPCFALTGPEAGSDAASITDHGIVKYGLWQGEKILGIELFWNKRYITLAPVATLLGLAFRLYDPEKLLSQESDPGITCALIPTSTPGVIIGRRHFPLNTCFLNGPTQGNGVFIPLDYIIGGPKMAGQGWRMLMECLSAGRATSLPASAVGGLLAATLGAGAYALIRRQFNQSIGSFEGIEEPLARIIGKAYICKSALKFTVAALDQGEEPAVAAAILKTHTTEMARACVNDAMDILGGKGICLGPRNFMGRHYQATPISITVEGANILTRSLIIFGQGAIRCHPFVIEELKSAQKGDLKRFDKALFHHLGHIFANIFRGFFVALTGGRFLKVPRGRLFRYFQILTRYSLAFAFLSELAILSLGADLKRREKLSARLGDTLSYLYLCSAVLKNYHDEGYPSEDLALVRWSCRELLYQTQESLFGIIKNFPNKSLGYVMHLFVFPFGRHLYRADDKLGHEVAQYCLRENPCRERLLKEVHQTLLDNNPLGQLSDLMHRVLLLEPLEKRIRKAIKDKTLEAGFSFFETIENAKKTGLINEEEASVLNALEKDRQNIIAVDDFADEDLRRI